MEARRLRTALVALCCAALGALAPAHGAPSTTRISEPGGGGDANADSLAPSLAADGGSIAFSSAASNLVGGDTNGLADVFVRSLATGSITLASAGATGPAAGGASGDPALSAEGRYVAFASAATDLVSGDGNGVADVFVRDLAAATTVRVAVPGVEPDGASRRPAIVARDGLVYVAFESDASNLVARDMNRRPDAFLAVLAAEPLAAPSRILLASLSRYGGSGSEASGTPSLSVPSGGLVRVAFESLAADLDRGGSSSRLDSNDAWDVFVADFVLGANTPTIRRISATGSGGPPRGDSRAPRIAADGRDVAYVSTAADLVTGDADGAADAFVTRDEVRATMPAGCRRSCRPVVTYRRGATVAASRAQVAATNPALEGLGYGHVFAVAISADGRLVAFSSAASNLVAGDRNLRADVFVRDRDTDADRRYDEPDTSRTERVSVSGAGVEANDASGGPSISADGALVAFWSAAFNLVASDGNACAQSRDFGTLLRPLTCLDVFLRARS